MKKETKIKILKISIIVIIFTLITLSIYLPLHLSGTLEKIDSIEELKQLILDGGMYSYFVFFLIQFLQVILLPIPALITTIAGTLVFGPLLTFIISLLAITIGSLLNFYIGRRFGKHIIIWIIGKDDAIKWGKKLSKGKYVFFLMMLFPIFPDDILCLVVGATTSISYKFFIITNLITRPISLASTCFLGSGQLIPFSGWGIPIWILIFILGALLFYYSIKYQSKIEKYIDKLEKKLSNIFSTKHKTTNLTKK